MSISRDCKTGSDQTDYMIRRCAGTLSYSIPLPFQSSDCRLPMQGQIQVQEFPREKKELGGGGGGGGLGKLNLYQFFSRGGGGETSNFFPQKN